MAFERGVNAGRNIREASIAAVNLDLSRVPRDLPLNVQNMAHLVLTRDEMAITSMDVLQIADKIRTSQVSCETVTRAFLRRAALAQYLVNCIAELLPEHAIERARYLDSLSEPLGPLHGVPVSIKEQVGFDGKTNNFGYVAWGDRLQGPPCSLNHRLEAAGAIIFARTTQPQTVMHLETNSNLYGRTVNPCNRNLTNGGSSGGEAALLGVEWEPAVGGDIGGSIRNPAANCGVYGFKPTPYRIGNTGGMAHIAGQDGIIGCMGPMSTSLAGLELFMQAYFAQSPWIEESSLVPLPWRDPKLPAKLKIGAMWSDGVVKPHPPVNRAMQMVVDALKTAGVMIIDWKPEKHEECWEITNALYFEDGGKRARNLLDQGDEPALPLTRWLLEENMPTPQSSSNCHQYMSNSTILIPQKLGYNMSPS